MEQKFAGGHPMPGLATDRQGQAPDDFGPPTIAGLPAGDAGPLENDVRDGPKAFAVSSNKPLTSKFRGVCWNKKNKRWQSAINSSGKYLYLGSYDAEEEAARVFDKAAVRIRYDKARLNFHFNDYVDESGAILPDQMVEALLLEACNPTKPRRQRNKTKAAGQDAAGADGEGEPGPASTAPPPTTDATSAEIALQALARLYGPGGPKTAGGDLSSGGPGGASGSGIGAPGVAGVDGVAGFQVGGLHQQPASRLQLSSLPPARHALDGLGLQGPQLLVPNDGGMQLQALLEGGLGTLNAQSLSRTAYLLGAGGGGAGGPGGLGPNSGPGGWDLYGNSSSATAAALAALQGQGQGQHQGPGSQQGLANLLGSMQRPLGAAMGGSNHLLRPLALPGGSDTATAMSSLGVNVPPHLLELVAASGQPHGGAAGQQLRSNLLGLSGHGGAGMGAGQGAGPASAPPPSHDMFPSHQLSTGMPSSGSRPVGSGPSAGPGPSGAGPGQTGGSGALSRGDLIQAHLPPGAELQHLITSSNPDVLGVLYAMHDSDKHGAGVWNEQMQRFNNLGLYGSESDAKQSINGVMSMYHDMGQQNQSTGQQQVSTGRASHPPLMVSGQGGGGTAGPPAPIGIAAPGGSMRSRDRGLMAGMGMPGTSGTPGAAVKTEICIGPAGWQPDPTCEDPQGGMSEDESGTGAGAGGGKRRREGQSQGLGRHGSGYGADDPVVPEDRPQGGDGRPDKRQRGPGAGAGTSDLCTLQNLANIDVRQALHMFFNGKQQG